jgi:hypothetical protein
LLARRSAYIEARRGTKAVRGDNARAFISRLEKLRTFASFFIESALHSNGTVDITVPKFFPSLLGFVPMLFKLLSL